MNKGSNRFSRLGRLKLWGLALCFFSSLLSIGIRANNPAQTWVEAKTKQEENLYQLKTLKIANIDFHDATINDVFTFFQHQSKILTPDHKGLNLVLSLKAPGTQLESGQDKISISLKDISFRDALRKILPLLGYSYRVDSQVVEFCPKISGFFILESRSYLLRSNPFKLDPAKAMYNGAAYDVRDQLLQWGIKCDAQYDPAHHRLSVFMSYGQTDTEYALDDLMDAQWR